VPQIELHFLAEQPAQQNLQFRKGVADLQHFRAKRLAARKSQQLRVRPAARLAVCLICMMS